MADLVLSLRIVGWVFTREPWRPAVRLGARLRLEECEAVGFVFETWIGGGPTARTTFCHADGEET